MPTKPGILVLTAATLALAGCADATRPDLGSADNWGEANRQTMAAQIIDPNPEYDTQVPVSSGDHAAQAIERYRTDSIKQPTPVRTTNTRGGGPSGG